MTVDSRLRDYRIFTPSTIDNTKPAPVVVVLHGSPIDAAGFVDFVHFDDEAVKAGFVEVAPNGCDGLWEYAEGRSGVADDDFLMEMFQQIRTQPTLDKSRMFVVGWSAGSWIAYRLACDLAGSISAMASISGTMRLSDDCNPQRAVSVLEMHGSLDAELPWQGGGPNSAFPVDAVARKWASLDGCAAVPVSTQNGTTETSLWTQCQAGARVRLDKIIGGDHGWFVTPSPGVPDANAAIWSFFSGATTEGS